MDFKKLVVAGIAGGVTLYIVSFIVGLIVQAIWPYNILELGGMRSVDDPVMLLFFLHPFVWSFAMAAAYQVFSPAIKGNFVQKGKVFGALVWLVAGIPSAFVVYSSMNYPLGFTVESFAGSFFYLMTASIAIAKVSE